MRWGAVWLRYYFRERKQTQHTRHSAQLETRSSTHTRSRNAQQVGNHQTWLRLLKTLVFESLKKQSILFLFMGKNNNKSHNIFRVHWASKKWIDPTDRAEIRWECREQQLCPILHTQDPSSNQDRNRERERKKNKREKIKVKTEGKNNYSLLAWSEKKKAIDSVDCRRGNNREKKKTVPARVLIVNRLTVGWWMNKCLEKGKIEGQGTNNNKKKRRTRDGLEGNGTGRNQWIQ